MSKTVWKYDLMIDNHAQAEMPRGAQILSAADQDTNRYTLQVWALVDPDAPKVKRGFTIVGTGHEHERIRGTFVGTVLKLRGGLVFHVFVDDEN